MGKIKALSKCDMITEELIKLIANKTYRPGDKLPTEPELVETFGVSRVTVRESLKTLSSMGIISIRQGEGTFVNTFNLNSMMKPLYSFMVVSDLDAGALYDARLYVEAGTAALAAKNCRGEMTQIRNVLDKMRVAIDNEDKELFALLDWEFHCAIGEASGNDVLLNAYLMIRDIVKIYIKKTIFDYDVMERSHRYHRNILEAIEGNDERLAGELMKAHIEKSKDTVLLVHSEE